MLRSTFPENASLAQVVRANEKRVGSQCDRGYLYASSVVHATEIHLRSLIGGTHMYARIHE